MTLILSGTNGLSDVDGSAATPAIRGTDANTGMFFPAADTIAFAEGGVEAMRLDSAGNVGIGTSSPGMPLDVVSNSGANAISIRGRASDNIGTLSFLTNNGASTDVQIQMRPSDNELRFLVTGARSQTFYTNGSERARIDSSGNLRIGTTGNVIGSGERLSIQTSNSNSAGVGIKGSESYLLGLWNSTVGSSNLAYFFAGTGASFVGSISTNGSTSTSYNTSSDYRLKNTIAPMTGALAKVAALKPCTYKWKVDGSDGEGFVAHELAEVCPDAVTGAKDAVDEEGKPVYQGIDTSFLVATLTAAIQEQQAMIEQLKADVAVLKGAV